MQDIENMTTPPGQSTSTPKPTSAVRDVSPAPPTPKPGASTPKNPPGHPTVKLSPQTIIDIALLTSSLTILSTPNILPTLNRFDDFSYWFTQVRVLLTAHGVAYLVDSPRRPEGTPPSIRIREPHAYQAMVASLSMQCVQGLALEGWRWVDNGDGDFVAGFYDTIQRIWNKQQKAVGAGLGCVYK
jgi:hypothetical protein